MREALPSSTVLKSSVALALADPRVETGTRHVLPTALQPSPTNSNKQLKSSGPSRAPHDSHSASEVSFKDSDAHTGRGEACRSVPEAMINGSKSAPSTQMERLRWLRHGFHSGAERTTAGSERALGETMGIVSDGDTRRA